LDTTYLDDHFCRLLPGFFLFFLVFLDVLGIPFVELK
jgi:hypothetical protein